MPAEAALTGSVQQATKGWEHHGKEGLCLSPCSGSAQHQTCLFPCLEYKFTATRSQGLPAKEDLFRLEENRAENSLSVPRTPPPSYTLLSQAHQGRGKASEPSSPPPFLPGDPQAHRGLALRDARCSPTSWERARRLTFPCTARAPLAQGKCPQPPKGCGREEQVTSTAPPGVTERRRVGREGQGPGLISCGVSSVMPR